MGYSRKQDTAATSIDEGNGVRAKKRKGFFFDQMTVLYNFSFFTIFYLHAQRHQDESNFV